MIAGLISEYNPTLLLHNMLPLMQKRCFALTFVQWQNMVFSFLTRIKRKEFGLKITATWNTIYFELG